MKKFETIAEYVSRINSEHRAWMDLPTAEMRSMRGREITAKVQMHPKCYLVRFEGDLFNLNLFGSPVFSAPAPLETVSQLAQKYRASLEYCWDSVDVKWSVIG